MKISIIIPCHNRYDIFDYCLPYLEKQTEKDFEVIIIDDYSENNLFDALIQYREKSELDIKLFKNETNLGPGATRNLGIEKAQGEYIMFIDSDDYIVENAIASLCECICETYPDCIFFDFFKINNKKRMVYHSYHNIVGKISQKDALLYANNSTWCKIVKSEIAKMKDVFFGDFSRGEDYVFTKLALTQCNSIMYIRKPLYCYINTRDSIMNNQIVGQYYLEIFNDLRDRMVKMPSEVLDNIYMYEMVYCRLFNALEKGAKNNDIYRIINEIELNKSDWYQTSIIRKTSFKMRCFYFMVKKHIVSGIVLMYRIKKSLLIIKNK